MANSTIKAMATKAELKNKITMTHIKSVETTGTQSVPDLSDYDIIFITIYDTGNYAVHGSNMVSYDTFKLYNTSAHALGISCYLTARAYFYVSYNTDTSIYAQVSSGFGGAIYGVKLS